MRRRNAELDPELEALLEFSDVERRLRPEVRARVLGRSRATVLGGEAFMPAPPPDGRRRSLSGPVQRGRGVARLALAASIAIVAGTVGALAALRARATRDPPAAVADRPLAVPTVVPGNTIPDPAPEAPTAPLRRVPTAKLARTPRAADRFTAEAALLQRAHIAYVRHDFFGRAVSGRRAWTPFPDRSPRRGARGAARRITRRPRVDRRSEAPRRRLCGTLSAERSPAPRRCGLQRSRMRAKDDRARDLT